MYVFFLSVHLQLGLGTKSVLLEKNHHILPWNEGLWVSLASSWTSQNSALRWAQHAGHWPRAELRAQELTTSLLGWLDVGVPLGVGELKAREAASQGSWKGAAGCASCPVLPPSWHHSTMHSLTFCGLEEKCISWKRIFPKIILQTLNRRIQKPEDAVPQWILRRESSI